MSKDIQCELIQAPNLNWSTEATNSDKSRFKNQQTVEEKPEENEPNDRVENEAQNGPGSQNGPKNGPQNGSQNGSQYGSQNDRETFSVSDGETTRIMEELGKGRETFSSSDGETSSEMITWLEEKVRFNPGIHAKVKRMIFEALSELIGFFFHLLRSIILNIPGFNLKMIAKDNANKSTL